MVVTDGVVVVCTVLRVRLELFFQVPLFCQLVLSALGIQPWPPNSLYLDK